jgi:uncharacterized membrane protein YphA (DoxX/SURF4 family)
MMQLLQRLQQTTPRKIMLLPRLLAGVPMVFFGASHFMNPQHMREILTAGGVPMVEVNIWAAASALVLGGVLLLGGFFARVGGLLGIVTMAPAIVVTIQLARVPNPPFVPPLPVPILVLAASAVVLVLGGGAWSGDARVASPTRAARRTSEIPT